MMSDLMVIDNDKVELIKRTVAKDATDDELELFLHQARKMGLDPLARQIHFQKYKNKKTGKSNVSFITTIDGYRLIADRTGKYAGNGEPVFNGEINSQEYGAGKGPNIPAKATVTVFKIVGGYVREFSNSAYWQEYYPGEWKGHMWRKMPHVMLAKVAEAGALRKAFPADLSGAYTADEMEQAHVEVIAVTSESDVVVTRTGKYKTELESLAVIVDHEHESEPEPEPLITDKQRRQLHAVGTKLYGDAWDDKRAEMSAAFEVKSSNEWTKNQTLRVIGGMNNKLDEQAENVALFEKETEQE